MKIIRLFIIVFILSHCGIPSNELFEDLNAPKNLTVTKIGSGNVTINFWAYNPEENFSGYNIYMTSDSEAVLTSQHALHINDSQINTNVRTTSIVKNKDYSYPTITDSDAGVIAVRSAPGSITFTFDKAPNNQIIAVGAVYYIAVSAFSSTNNLESGLSNIVFFVGG